MPRRAAIIIAAVALAVLVAACGSTGSSSSPSVSPSPEAVSWLFSTTSEGGTLKETGDGGHLLTLTGVDEHTIAFADRPDRDVNVIATGDFVASWEKNFADDPPNAVLVEHNPKGATDSLVLVLSDPTYDAEAATLTYAATVTTDEHPDRVAALVGEAYAEVPASFREASLFIDNFSGVAGIPYTGFTSDTSGHFARAPNPDPPTYAVGDQVVAPWIDPSLAIPGSGHYYLATVMEVVVVDWGRGLVVRYIDDGTEGLVNAQDARPTKDLTFVVGDEVYAVWTTGRLYSGTITAVDGSTNPVTYTVKWDDGSPPSQVPAGEIIYW